MKLFLKKMNKKVDIWSMGVILYLLTYGRLPLQHIKNQLKKMYAICDPTQQDIKFPPTTDPSLDDTLKVKSFILMLEIRNFFICLFNLIRNALHSNQKTGMMWIGCYHMLILLVSIYKINNFKFK